MIIAISSISWTRCKYEKKLYLCIVATDYFQNLDIWYWKKKWEGGGRCIVKIVIAFQIIKLVDYNIAIDNIYRDQYLISYSDSKCV